MHVVSRRSLMKSSLTAIAVSPLLPLLSPSSAFATTLPTLSASAVSATKSAFTTLFDKLKTNTATPLNVQSAATALTVLIGNMHETGFNAAVAPLIKSAVQSLISSGADESQKVRSLLAANGISITSSQAEQWFHPTEASLEAILSGLASPGLTTLEMRGATDLANVAKAMEAQGIKTMSDPAFPKARLLRVGCGADGLAMGILSLLSPPPIDIIFAIGGLVYGFLDLFEPLHQACGG